jgi:hypothetical protein
VLERQSGALKLDLLEFLHHRNAPRQCILDFCFFLGRQGPAILSLSGVQHLLKEGRASFFSAF